jgi:lycopene beta-cyclase
VGTSSYDVVLIGAGLAGGLSALALTTRRPSLRVLLLERAEAPAGNHTWCFHAGDCPGEARTYVEPLVAARWNGHRVRFPHRERTLVSPYACISSDRLRDTLVSLGAEHKLRLECNADVVRVAGDHVLLADGRRFDAALVVDTRGPEERRDQDVAYQKFLGLELEVEPDHGIDTPMLMDAGVPQRDGFRFVYVLPLAPGRVLVEDTYYSERPQLDEPALRAGILDYARGLGLRVRRELRSERGVLPLPLATALPEEIVRSPVRAGYAGGYFHPVTGYSFPLAVRFAEALAATDLRQLAGSPLQRFSADVRARLPFYYALTRAMFQRFAPEARYGVLEHFYRLPEPLIARFYAARMSPFDRLRMFVGLPPRGLSLRRIAALPREVTP